MAHSFHTAAQQRIYEKVGCYLAEIGVTFAAGDGEIPGYVVQHGSASASIVVLSAGAHALFAAPEQRSQPRLVRARRRR
jgi:hypothetical protein